MSILEVLIITLLFVFFSPNIVFKPFFKNKWCNILACSLFFIISIYLVHSFFIYQENFTTTPSETTNPPSETTNPPSGTTNSPSGTTNPPSETTRPPSGTPDRRAVQGKSDCTTAQAHADAIKKNISIDHPGDSLYNELMKNNETIGIKVCSAGYEYDHSTKTLITRYPREKINNIYDNTMQTIPRPTTPKPTTPKPTTPNPTTTTTPNPTTTRAPATTPSRPTKK